MRLCFVSREYPPNPMGGIGTYVFNMARVFAGSGDTVHVLTQDCPDAPSHGFDNPAVSCDGRLIVRYLPFADRNWNIAQSVKNPTTDALARCDCAAVFGAVASDALEKLLLAEPIDAIEAPEYEAPLLYFQERRAALPPDHPWQTIPTVVHLHSPSHLIFEHDDDPTDTAWALQRKAFEALSIEMADGVVAPSAFLARQVSRWLRFPERRVEVIPYPIGPLLEFDDAAAPEDGLCLFVGRVEPRKGVFEFAEAAVEVARKFPKARFRFVGGPHFRDGLETAAVIRSRIPNDLADRFDFAGKVPRETLGREYARASFAAVPSRWENFPNTCMEAMSCGRPVLTSDQGGMPEMIADESMGLCVGGETRVKLRENLVAGLEKMFAKSPDELLETGRRSRRRILEICDDSTIAERRRRYYRELGAKTREAVAARWISEVGVILFGDGADPRKIERAIASVNSQTIEAKVKIFVGDVFRVDSAARAELDSWKVVAPGKSVAAFFDGLPEVIYIGMADDVLASDALRLAANHFANRPGEGAACCWTTRGRVPFAEFLSVRPDVPARWFFRKSAIAECGGFPAVFDNPSEIAARIVNNGQRCGCVASPLVETAGMFYSPAKTMSGS